MEKEIIRDLIETYKNYRELWDPKDSLYSNKTARDKAYAALLEIYKRVDKDGTVRELKNKIENLRATYRKERRKVLDSEMRGDDEDSLYVPRLWYYKHMSFLNEIFVHNTNRWSQVDDTSYSETATGSSSKRRKTSPLPTVFVTSKTEVEEEEENSEEENAIYCDINEEQDEIEETPYFVNETPPSSKENKQDCQLKAFANVIGMQLKDVAPKQRFIAEKLISDVVFLARMNKLSVDSVVLANSLE